MIRTEKDTAVGALTPEGIEFVLFPAGLLIRSAACGIDKIIQWIVILVIIISSSFAQGAGGTWLVLLVNFVLDWFYHVICELAFRGQSPGKRIMGIRVVRSDGAPVDPSSSFLRNLLRFADTFFFFFPIALTLIAASPGFRRLGDWAAGTLVVYTPKVIGFSQQQPIAWLSKRGPIAPLYPLSHEEKQAILMFARRYPLLGEVRASEIARPYARLLRGGGESALPASASLSASSETRQTLSDAAYLLGIARLLLGETSAAQGQGAA